MISKMPPMKHIDVVAGTDARCRCGASAAIRLRADGTHLCAVHAREHALGLISPIVSTFKVTP